MSSLRRYIVVRGQYEGFHEWEDAPDEVAFLRNEHRHLFKWEVSLQVDHDDRELEFFMVKRQIETNINYWLRTKKWRHLGSCEQQAEIILGDAMKWYGEDRCYKVVVSEDGESDGIVIWTPE